MFRSGPLIAAALSASVAVTSCGGWIPDLTPSAARTPGPVPCSADSATGAPFVFVHGTQGERARLVEALPEVYAALTGDLAVDYIDQHFDLLIPRDQQTIVQRAGGGAPTGGTEARKAAIRALLSPATIAPAIVHIVPTDRSGPGISEICVHGDATTGAIGVSHKARLAADPFGEDDKARLINTIAHEWVHLHGSECADDVIDNGNDDEQCHTLSYVAGNIAACIVLKQTEDKEHWSTCMTEQAGSTPGGQNAASHDAFGCRIK